MAADRAQTPDGKDDASMKGWTVVSAIAGSAAAFAATLVSAPPPATVINAPLVNIARFVLAVIVGLAMFPLLDTPRRADRKRWSIVAALLFAVAVGSLAGYFVKSAGAVRVVLGQSFVIGELTPRAQEYKRDFEAKNRRELGVTELVLRFPGPYPERLYRVWRRETIQTNEEILALLYLLSIVAIGATVIATSQAVRCAQAKQ